MTITLEQYNTVVDGLRTQLELQRAFNKELYKSREAFKEAYSNNIERADITINAFQQEKEEAAKQIEQLKSENFNLNKELNKCVKGNNEVSDRYSQLRDDYEKLSVEFERYQAKWPDVV